MKRNMAVWLEASPQQARLIDSDWVETAQADWNKLILQDEFHHAWPQWLQGDPNQTLLYLPRVLHNFKAATDVGTGGFHQVFNSLFSASPFKTEHGIAINNSAAWAAYIDDPALDAGDRSEALDDIAQMMKDAYQTVLGPLLSDAKVLFDGEVEKELNEIK
jgi:hypothetical protein